MVVCARSGRTFELPSARPARPQEESKDKKKSGKDAPKEDKAKQPTKQEREYQKIRQFSQRRYAENPSFRDEVEEAYQQKKREHSEYAFDINTRNGLDQVTRDGDRLKINDTLYDNPLAQDYVNRVEKDHWREDVLVQHGMEAYNEQQQQKRSIIGVSRYKFKERGLTDLAFADADADRFVTAGELFAYVRHRVRFETGFRQNPRALPGLNADLSLAFVRKAAGGR